MEQEKNQKEIEENIDEMNLKRDDMKLSISAITTMLEQQVK